MPPPGTPDTVVPTAHVIPMAIPLEAYSIAGEGYMHFSGATVCGIVLLYLYLDKLATLCVPLDGACTSPEFLCLDLFAMGSLKCLWVVGRLSMFLSNIHGLDIS